MAIAIKTVPVLNEKVAKRFVTEAEKSLQMRGSINFSKQVEITNRILSKAELKK
jgi:hypothetical protein